MFADTVIAGCEQYYPQQYNLNASQRQKQTQMTCVNDPLIIYLTYTNGHNLFVVWLDTLPMAGSACHIPTPCRARSSTTHSSLNRLYPTSKSLTHPTWRIHSMPLNLPLNYHSELVYPRPSCSFHVDNVWRRHPPILTSNSYCSTEISVFTFSNNKIST